MGHGPGNQSSYTNVGCTAANVIYLDFSFKKLFFSVNRFSAVNPLRKLMKSLYVGDYIYAHFMYVYDAALLTTTFATSNDVLFQFVAISDTTA